MIASPLKILILEDNNYDALLVQRLLKKSHRKCKFEIATDRDGFIKALDHFQPEVILSDNSLPGFNATEALQIVKQSSLIIPFILVAGTVSEEFAAEMMRSGADDYLIKDRLTRLPAAIESALKQKQIENTKREAENDNKFKAKLLNTIAQAVIATDLNGVINFWNKAAEQIYGWTDKEAMGKNIIDLVPAKKTREDAVEIMKQLVSGHSWSEEFVGQRKNRDTFPAYVTNAPVYDQQNNLSGIIGVSSDITERKKYDSDLKDLNSQLRELSAHLQKVREEERIKIAREIHDDIGQQLAGLKMEISWRLKKLNTKDKIIKQRENGIITLIDETINSVKRILSDLRPSILDDLGLVAALEWLSVEVAKEFGIKVNFKADMPGTDLPEAAVTALFRIYQEALVTMARHAGTQEIKAGLQMNDTGITLQISDDGKGLNGANNNKPGLTSVKERTFILGGEYEFNSEPGKGSEIKISIPL